MEEPVPGPAMGSGLPAEAPKKKAGWKIVAVVVVLVMIIAGLSLYLLGQGAKETQPAIQSVAITSGTTGSLGSVGSAIGFRATGTGSIGSYEWDFGDGQKTTTTTNTSTHTYATDGAYIVLVTAKSSGGLTATNDNNLLQVTILDAAFQPGLTKVVSEGTVAPSIGQLSSGSTKVGVTANGSASHGFTVTPPKTCPPTCNADRSAIDTFFWNWSDGSAASTQADTTHDFTAAGNYPVKLTVTNTTNGASDSTIFTVRVTPAQVSIVKNAGVFVIANIGDPQYLDPAIDYETSGNEIVKNVYDRLIQRKVVATNPDSPTIQNDQFVGMAASSWTVSADQQTWNFTIRQGMMWQDSAYGQLDAYDVEYSLRRVLMINIGPVWIIDQYLTAYAADNPLTPADERWDAINASVVATDRWHVELRLVQPYGAVLQTLDFQVASIVSKAWIMAHGGTQLHTQNAYVNTHTMGSGPFKLDHWTPGVEMKLVKNPTYWGATKPRVEAVLYKLVPEPATQELLLKNGDVDWADGIPTRDIDTVKTWQGVVVKENPGLVVQYMGMVEDNSWIGDPARTINTSPFQDIHVRRAVAFAIDYNFIQTNVLAGHATQLKSGVPEGMPGWDGSFWNYQTNDAMAQAELAQANPAWRNGFATNLSLNSGNPQRVQTGVMVQARLKTVLNIDVTIRSQSWPTLLDDLDFRKDTGLYLLGWAPDYLDPDDYVKPLFHSSACPQPAGGDPLVSTAGSNNGCYRNAIVDSAIDNATSSTVWQERLENYTVVQQHIVQEAAWVFMYQPNSIDPIRSWVKGYFFDPMELRDLLYLGK